MANEAPPFWSTEPGWQAALLSPLSAAYGLVASRRLENAPRTPVGVPVLCIGNPTVGGAGKTPAAIGFARAAKALGLAPGFLSRGHGGSLGRAHLVDPSHDSAKAVGDEPLLLAREAPTAVTADRAAGARLLIGEGCDFLIMDDGFQSGRIRQDFALLVVDAARGLGNGRVLPAGPLRAPVVAQLRHAHAVLKMGQGSAADGFIRMASRAGRAIYEAEALAVAGSGVEGRDCLAFAGIGHPDKFFATVAAAGGAVKATRSFADHHYYTDEDLDSLVAEAEKDDLLLVTTAKDAVRMRHESPLASQLQQRLAVVEVEVRFTPADIAERIIRETLDNCARSDELALSRASARPD